VGTIFASRSMPPIISHQVLSATNHIFLSDPLNKSVSGEQLLTILSDEIIELMKKSQIKYVATADRSGKPNVTAIGSPIIDPTDKSQILIANISLNKTIENLQENKNVMVLFHTPFTSETRPPDFKTYQVTGVVVDDIKSGPQFEKFKELLSKRGTNPKLIDRLRSLLVVKIEKVYTSIPGNPSKQILP